MDISLSLHNFEGPLDLLLHLIKDKKVEIESISLFEITEVYLNIIKEHQVNNFEVGVDYLSIAAELIYMKSKKLLPILNIEDEDEIDLVQRLRLFEKYRETKPKFLELIDERLKYATKVPENFSLFEFTNTTLVESSFEDLVSAFEKMMQRLKFKKPLETRMARQEITIESRMDYVRQLLKQSDSFLFSFLIDEYNKELFVTSFLGILELVKTQEIFVNQTNNFEDILIERRL